MELFQSSWSDVTLQEYIDIQRINTENTGLLSRALETLCYLNDDDGWEDESSSVVIKTYSNNKWLSTQPINSTVQTLGNKILKPIYKLTVAEWIDLDDAIVEGDLIKIPAILYRQHKLDEWGNIIYEPYDFSPTERALEMDTISITDAIGIILEISEYRNTLHNAFSELFEEYEEELSDEEKDMLTDAEIKEIEQSIKSDNDKKALSWQRLLDDASGGDWSSIPKLLELPITFFLNMRLSRKVYGN